MEDTLRELDKNKYMLGKTVLILVLMEDTLRGLGIRDFGYSSKS